MTNLWHLCKPSHRPSCLKAWYHILPAWLRRPSARTLMFCSKATSTRYTMGPSSTRKIFAPDHLLWIFLELNARLLKRLNYMKSITKSSRTKMLLLLLPREYWREQAQCALKNAMNLYSPKDSKFKSVLLKNAETPQMPRRSLKDKSKKPLTWRSPNVMNLVTIVALIFTRLAYRD